MNKVTTLQVTRAYYLAACHMYTYLFNIVIYHYYIHVVLYSYIYIQLEFRLRRWLWPSSCFARLYSAWFCSYMSLIVIGHALIYYLVGIFIITIIIIIIIGYLFSILLLVFIIHPVIIICS